MILAKLEQVCNILTICKYVFKKKLEILNLNLIFFKTKQSNKPLKHDLNETLSRLAQEVSVKKKTGLSGLLSKGNKNEI